MGEGLDSSHMPEEERMGLDDEEFVNRSAVLEILHDMESKDYEAQPEDFTEKEMDLIVVERTLLNLWQSIEAKPEGEDPLSNERVKRDKEEEIYRRALEKVRTSLGRKGLGEK